VTFAGETMYLASTRAHVFYISFDRVRAETHVNVSGSESRECVT